MEQINKIPLSQTKIQSPSPLLPIKGVIFDLDGVLTDTSELHYLAWKKLADKEKINFTKEDNESLRGIPRRESLLLILKDKKASESEIEEMMERKNNYYIESISTLTKKDLLPGARDFLVNLRANGIKTAVGSASKNARTVIEKLGITDLLDAIADGSSVKNQKPAPDLFLYAAKLIKSPPSQCVVFEDAAAGIESAIAGGMWAIGIGPKSRLERAHVIFQNLEELSVKKMSEALTRVT
jgi:kojibiose phosphorylase